MYEIFLKGVFAKNERGYRRLIPNNLAAIQIEKIATYDLDRKKSI